MPNYFMLQSQPAYQTLDTAPGTVNYASSIFIENPISSPSTQNDGWKVEHIPPSVEPLETIQTIYQKIYGKDKMPETEKFYNRSINKVINFRNGKKKGLIGLEIECEGKNLTQSVFNYWEVHNDGSLRPIGEHQPVEYVLSKPLDYPDIIKALKYLEAKLKEANSKVMLSTRTSIHVHINCQSWTFRQLYCYILLYIIFEEILVEFSGPDRIGNLFCLRAKDSDFYVTMLEDVLKNSSIKGWREEVRYSACNISSIPKFGSLEFRSMKGTVDIELIQTWISMLLLLRDKSLEYDNPVDIINEFVSIGPLPFFKKIWHRTTLRHYLEETKGLSGKLWDGLRIARDVAHCCDWEKPMEKKDKPESLNLNQSEYITGQYFDGPQGPEIIQQFYHTNSTYDAVVVELDHEVPHLKTIYHGHTVWFCNSVDRPSMSWLFLDSKEGNHIE